ncbi:hypothetical protein PC115_g14207 [Phytophthora cactorum]|uniref:Uncharacterized protein n=1 Tax=Phytophthora cactorum TaxID=29920 RepID=A0A8T1BQE2_9STRA|nr:hypothetical protein PC115_g14207 [Phytophthora cactorum]
MTKALRAQRILRNEDCSLANGRCTGRVERNVEFPRNYCGVFAVGVLHSGTNVLVETNENPPALAELSLHRDESAQKKRRQTLLRVSQDEEASYYARRLADVKGCSSKVVVLCYLQASNRKLNQ